MQLALTIDCSIITRLITNFGSHNFKQKINMGYQKAKIRSSPILQKINGIIMSIILISHRAKQKLENLKNNLCESYALKKKD